MTAMTLKALEAAGWTLQTQKKTAGMLANRYILRRGGIVIFVDKSKSYQWEALVRHSRDYGITFESFGSCHSHSKEEALQKLAIRPVGMRKGMLAGECRVDGSVDFASWALAPEGSIVSDPLTLQVRNFVLGFNACNRDKRTETEDYKSAAYYLCGFTNVAYEKYGPALMTLFTSTQGFGIPDSLIPQIIDIISQKVSA